MLERAARGDRERVASGVEGERPSFARQLVITDLPPRLGVEDDHPPLSIAGRERASVRAQGERLRRARIAAQDAERGWAPQQRREQAGAGRERVVQGDARVGEHQRLVEAVLGERLGPEPLRGLRRGCATRALALGERDHPRDEGGGEQHADPGEQRSQAAIRPALALGVALARGPALLEELALELVQLGLVAGSPVERRGKPGAAVELGRIAVGGLPFRRGVDQVLVKAPALGVVCEPVAKARPLAKQRLVGDLDRVLVDGHEAALGEHGEGSGGLWVALRLELCERHPPAHQGRLLGVREAQQDRPRPLALGFCEAPVGALGKARDRAAHRAARRIARPAQGTSASLLPELEQGGGEQGKAAGLVGDVVDQLRDQAGLDPQAGPLGRKLDRPAQLLARHRPDQQLVGADLCGQRPVVGAAPVEVGPDREYDDRALVGVGGRGDERLGKGGPLALVATGGEQLFELIDGEDKALVGCERGERRGHRVVTVPSGCEAREGATQFRERVLPRSHQRLPPALRAWQHPVCQRGQKSGANDGGLAASGWPEDRQPGGADQARDQPGDQPLAAEEILGVHRIERCETAERTDLGRRRIDRFGDPVQVCAFAGGLEVGDASSQLRLGRAQLALARRTGDLCVQPLGRQRLGPGARHPVHANGDPVALGHQRRDRHRDAVGGRVERGDLGGCVDPQAIQGQALRPCRPLEVRQRRRSPLAPAEDEDEQGDPARLPAQQGRGLEHRGRSVLRVVEDEQRRALALARAADRAQSAGPRGVQNDAPAAVYLGRELGRKPGLADPGRAHHKRHP